MDFILHFNIDNDEFNSNVDYAISRILLNVSKDILVGEMTKVIMDSNGNTIGEWKIEG
jgi:hypothetical protein